MKLSIENEEYENNLAIRIYYVAKYGLKSAGVGGEAPPRIQDLFGKFFEICQNLIFPIIRAPPE